MFYDGGIYSSNLYHPHLFFAVANHDRVLQAPIFVVKQ